MRDGLQLCSERTAIGSSSQELANGFCTASSSLRAATCDDPTDTWENSQRGHQDTPLPSRGTVWLSCCSQARIARPRGRARGYGGTTTRGKGQRHAGILDPHPAVPHLPGRHGDRRCTHSQRRGRSSDGDLAHPRLPPPQGRPPPRLPPTRHTGHPRRMKQGSAPGRRETPTGPVAACPIHPRLSSTSRPDLRRHPAVIRRRRRRHHGPGAIRTPGRHGGSALRQPRGPRCSSGTRRCRPPSSLSPVRCHCAHPTRSSRLPGRAPGFWPWRHRPPESRAAVAALRERAVPRWLPESTLAPVRVVGNRLRPSVLTAMACSEPGWWTPWPWGRPRSPSWAWTGHGNYRGSPEKLAPYARRASYLRHDTNLHQKNVTLSRKGPAQCPVTW